MTNKKNSQPNPIEEAIGDRAKDPKAQEKFTKEYQTEPLPEIPESSSPQTPQELDEPTPSEMLTLEELNYQTEQKLQDQYPEEQVEATHTVPKVPIIPVSKPDPQPVTTTSSKESPPQKIDDVSEKAFEITKNVERSNEQTLQEVNSGVELEEIDEYADALKSDEISEPVHRKLILHTGKTLAEDIELTNLRKYIFEDGFVLATVAFHIVTLCAQPLVTPTTTTWDFRDRAMIPDMVFALLKQPGYLEGIWPSLAIMMGDNKGNSAWASGIATTIAFFDTVKVLPILKEMKDEKDPCVD